jgi:hypothetical protein
MTEKQTENLASQLQLRKYNPEHTPKQNTIVLTVGGSIAGTLQNFCIATGMPKVGKSTIIAGLIASSMQFNDVFGIKVTFPPERRGIVYFDTETAEYDFYKQIDRIKSLADIQTVPDYFAAFNFREDEPPAILEFIEHYLKENLPPVVIIDGLLDCIYDFNDSIASKKLVNLIKRWGKKYNCLIIGVIHQGKTTGGNTLGHLGAMTDRYAQTTLEIIRNKDNTFTISPKLLRSDKYFDPINLINNNGIFSIIESEKSNLEQNNNIELMRKVLKAENNYKQLVEDIQEYSGKSLSYAKKVVKDWIVTGYIVKDGSIYKLAKAIF